MADLKAIIGLGNPGSKYAETRHNAGFWFIDELSSDHGVALKPQKKLLCDLVRAELHGRPCLLVKPDTYMNRSGQCVRAVLDYYGVAVEDTLIAYDELDLPVGCTRIKQGGGHGGHNGLRDIFAHLGSREFVRLRIGIGHPGDKSRVTGYVLSRPNKDDELAVRSSIRAALEVLPSLLDGDLARAQKRLHTEA